MATIEQQLSALVAVKKQLANILKSKGIEASESETFTTLVPKVNDLKGPSWQEVKMSVSGNVATATVPTGVKKIRVKGGYSQTHYLQDVCGNTIGSCTANHNETFETEQKSFTRSYSASDCTASGYDDYMSQTRTSSGGGGSGTAKVELSGTTLKITYSSGYVRYSKVEVYA